MHLFECHQEIYDKNIMDSGLCTVKVKKMHPDALIPRFQTAGAAGFDLHCLAKTVLLPGQHVAVRTGLALAVPPGYALLVYPRSGHARKYGITLSNAVGVIDSDYREEVLVLLYNAGSETVTFTKGDRIAQAVVHRLPPVSIQEVAELEETTRKGGFGSTGNK